MTITFGIVLVALVFVAAVIVARFCSRAPIGYEDSSGYHYGSDPSDSNTKE